MKHQYHLSKQTEKIISVLFDESGSKTINKIILRYFIIINENYIYNKKMFSKISLNAIYECIDSFEYLIKTHEDLFKFKNNLIINLSKKNQESLAIIISGFDSIEIISLIESYEQKKNKSDSIEESGSSLIFD